MIFINLDKLAAKEYNYYYEDGRIIRATECDIVMSDAEIVTSKTVVNSIRYTYDSDGNLTKKVITPTGDEPFTYYYETTDDNTVVKFVADGKNVTCHSKNDSFGRKEFDEIQTGAGFISRQFSYHTGDFTADNKDNEKLKSTPTTQLVNKITLSNGRTLEYEYGAEERITKVIDSEEGTTEYTYDALGQMLTETKNGAVINNMVYNSYGNILAKSGDMYFYDSVWKDRLTQISYNETDVNGNVTGVAAKTITYDAQGNPTNYFGNVLEWEKGRQLKKYSVYSNGLYLSDITYTYNANGIRTSKTVAGAKHTYVLDGTKIFKESWTASRKSHVLVPLYDNEDSVCGVNYNGTPYYFQKNLQGDIIAIADASGAVVGKYSYDAWGKCTNITTLNADGTVSTSTTHIAKINPFRYRGYYFDQETGFYYLQSRYYDPTTGRFINGDEADIITSSRKILNSNCFAYCNNNPICKIDVFGYSVTLVIGGVTLSIGTVAAFIALTAFAVKYVCDRSFRNAVNDLVCMLIEGVVNAVSSAIDYLSNVISDVVTTAKNSRKQWGKEDHHIVAQNDYRAESTRRFIGSYGISTSSSYNIVSIKKTLHRHLHTNAYHAAVEMALRYCANRKNSWNDKKYAIIAGMVFIGVLLKSASRIF